MHSQLLQPHVLQQRHETGQFIIAVLFIDTDACFYRNRHRHRLPHGRDTSRNPFRLQHETGTERSGLRPVAGVTDVQVDFIETRLFSPYRTAGQFFRLTATELNGQAVFRRIEGQQVAPVTVYQRSRADLLRMRGHMPGNQPQKIAAVAIGSVHHGGCRHWNHLINFICFIFSVTWYSFSLMRHTQFHAKTQSF